MVKSLAYNLAENNDVSMELRLCASKVFLSPDLEISPTAHILPETPLKTDLTYTVCLGIVLVSLFFCSRVQLFPFGFLLAFTFAH